MSVLDLTGPADLATATTPCRDHDPELWFADRPDDIALAQALCADCPLRLPCLTGAIDRAEPWGVWGGELFENGMVIARKRRPGRPRKDDAARAAAADTLLRDRLSRLAPAGVPAPRG